MSEKQTVIALNGQLQGSKKDYYQFLDYNNDFFIAADGGALLLENIEIVPDVILGDFDSLEQVKLDFYRKQNSIIIRYPVEKDETDGELALNYCLEHNLDNIKILGSQGGRIDQQWANILLLEYAYQKGLNAVIREPGSELGIIGAHKQFKNFKGNILSLIPLDQIVSGITITGCKYPLQNEDLIRYRSKGISNIIESNIAEVSTEEGLLIYICQSTI
ncbi:MAG: thiamine diphosphokinase [Halanaerobiaceae bacterium]